jgi:hypothetical protein
MTTDKTTFGAKVTRTPGLKGLISPLAEYIAAADDRHSALAEVLSELIGEAVAVEREASRHLENGQH